MKHAPSHRRRSVKPGFSTSLEAEAIHRRHPVVDAHSDFLWKHLRQGSDFVTGKGCRQFSLVGLRRARIRIQGAALFTEAFLKGPEATQAAKEMIAYLKQQATDHPKDVGIVTTVRDIDRVLDDPDGPIGFMLWIEGASPFAGRANLVEEFLRLGVRGVGFTHNHGNEVADGCGVEAPLGLTDFGRYLVHYLYEAGCIIDLAHLAPPGFRDVIHICKGPICVSHTGLRHFVDIPRNLDDLQVHAIADTGGVVGIDFYPGHIGRLDPRKPERIADVRNVFAAIDHVVQLVGEDHVGLGSDFDGFSNDCMGLEDADHLPNLTQVMLDNGYDETRIAKILGGNWLRFFRDALF